MQKTRYILQLIGMALIWGVIPVIFNFFLWRIPGSSTASFIFLGLLSLFLLLDWLLGLFLAENKQTYVRKNWFYLIPVIPVLAPLIVVRLILFLHFQLFREGKFRQLLIREDLVITILSFTILLSSTIFFTIERGVNTNISTYPDALWWVMVTITTVGYGEIVPATSSGRVIAIVTMILGIGAFTALAGRVALLLRGNTISNDDLKSIVREVKILQDEIKKLKQKEDNE